MTAHADPRRDAFDALVAWWREAGVDEVAPPPAPRAAPPPKRGKAPPPRPSLPPKAPPAADLSADARALAASCKTLDDLEKALAGFAAHPLHAAARNTVFARGDRDAAVMVIGEAPGREEDAQGKPFVGRSGQLLDKMFAAIDLTEAKGLYITNILNWRPPGNRSPNSDEIELCRPFIERHVALKKPKFIVLAGGVAAQTLLKTTTGIMRLRGRWAEVEAEGAAYPALPIFHPAFVLRRPVAKREVWADLLALEERLGDG